jgi:hypothetical protein
MNEKLNNIKNPYLLNISNKNIQLEKNKINFFPKLILSDRFFDQFKEQNIYGVNTGLGLRDFSWNKDIEISDLKIYNFSKDCFDRNIHAQSLIGGKVFRFEEKDENHPISYYGIEDNDIFFSVLMKNFNPKNCDLLIVNDFVSGLSQIAKIVFYQQLKQINKIFGITVLLVTEDILTLNIAKVDDFVLFANENQKFEIEKFFELISVIGNDDLYNNVIKEVSTERIRKFENEQKQSKIQEKINHSKKRKTK